MEEELEQGTEKANRFWEDIHKAVPRAKKYQLMGNHDERPLKRALETAPELVPLVGKSLRDLYTFPHVTTIHDPKEELEIDNIFFMHGFRSRLGDHARYNQKSTACGHSHTGGVVFQRNALGCYFELNCGYLGDPSGPVFGYRAQRKMHTWTLGAGWIDGLGPRFMPYPGDK